MGYILQKQVCCWLCVLLLDARDWLWRSWLTFSWIQAKGKHEGLCFVNCATGSSRVERSVKLGQETVAWGCLDLRSSPADGPIQVTVETRPGSRTEQKGTQNGGYVDRFFDIDQCLDRRDVDVYKDDKEKASMRYMLMRLCVGPTLVKSSCEGERCRKKAVSSTGWRDAKRRDDSAEMVEYASCLKPHAEHIHQYVCHLSLSAVTGASLLSCCQGYKVLHFSRGKWVTQFQWPISTAESGSGGRCSEVMVHTTLPEPFIARYAIHPSVWTSTWVAASPCKCILSSLSEDSVKRQEKAITGRRNTLCCRRYGMQTVSHWLQTYTTTKSCFVRFGDEAVCKNVTQFSQSACHSVKNARTHVCAARHEEKLDTRLDCGL